MSNFSRRPFRVLATPILAPALFWIQTSVSIVLGVILLVNVPNAWTFALAISCFTVIPIFGRLTMELFGMTYQMHHDIGRMAAYLAPSSELASKAGRSDDLQMNRHKVVTEILELSQKEFR